MVLAEHRSTEESSGTPLPGAPNVGYRVPAKPLRFELWGAHVRTPIPSHIDLAGNTSYHFAASRTVFPRVSPYLCPGPFAPFGSRI